MESRAKGEQGSGPTWRDLEGAVQEVERQRGTHVLLQLMHTVDNRSGRFYWTAYASVRGYNKLKPDSVIGASYPFRGAGGAATAPAAFYLALLELDDKLEDAAAAAEQQAMF